MGGAIAKGLASIEMNEVRVVNRSIEKLQTLKTEFPQIIITQKHQEAIDGADIIIFAVKPWLMRDILSLISFNPSQIVISVAAGISFDELHSFAPNVQTIYRIIPNTAIANKMSMNIISSSGSNSKQDNTIDKLFSPLGANIFLPENKMAAATSIASCGIAYIFKYIQAAMQAGIEMGLTPQEAKKLAAQSAIGAGSILTHNPELHPSTEIDKVTTPGGLTIKGINQLEKNNFSNTVIEAIKKSI